MSNRHNEVGNDVREAHGPETSVSYCRHWVHSAVTCVSRRTSNDSTSTQISQLHRRHHAISLSCLMHTYIHTHTHTEITHTTITHCLTNKPLEHIICISNNEKSAQRDANTARALAVVRVGHRPPTRPPVTDKTDYNTLRRS